MGCTVRELLERISSEELTEWMAFYSIEPWGCEAKDERAGIIAAAVVNFGGMGGPKKMALPEELVPRLKRAKIESGRKDAMERARAMRRRRRG